MNEIDPLFAFHKLNPAGQAKAKLIAERFTALASFLAEVIPSNCREASVARTKLEESCFFAKKAMAIHSENQEPPTA